MLRQNRRQLDPTEREALAAYRDGNVAGSQAIRSEAGWEHRRETPQATRQALAAAAVADADVHGTAAVAVLAASHADCEDLADRVREIRTARGELAGEFLSGPGWGPEPRRYAASDRILLHTRYGAGADRLHNGTTATVAEVSTLGLRVALDDGRAATLPAAFVEGRRRDRTPTCRMPGPAPTAKARRALLLRNVTGATRTRWRSERRVRDSTTPGGPRPDGRRSALMCPPDACAGGPAQDSQFWGWCHRSDMRSDRTVSDLRGARSGQSGASAGAATASQFPGHA